jgi:uncharacterized protein YjiS (DUF1127 family)
MAHMTTTPFAQAGLFTRMKARFDDMRQAWRNYAEYRQTFDELSRLSDRELADVGLMRCDIEEVARYHLDRI